MRFCRPLQTTAKVEDVFKVVAAYFDNTDLK